MDPITHTFVGASLSATGLRRTTPLAAPTLVLGANAPDVDIVAQAWGPYAALAWRRGLTHGLPALLVLPFLVAGVVLAWDRFARHGRRPHLDPVRPGALLGLAFLGALTHPALDWVNTYGMRWLMPFADDWSYGDSVFIVDPWLWLLLGGSLFVLHSARTAARISWGALGFVMALLIVGSGIPTAAKLLWLAGAAGWIVIRFRLSPASDPDSAERHEGIARWAFGGATAYLLLMVAQTPVAERVTLAEAREAGVGPVIDAMVGPVPANPFRSEVILRTSEGYHRGGFTWLPIPRLELDPSPLQSHPRDAIVQAAEAHPEARRYLTWVRFPWIAVHEGEAGWQVEIRDVRYMDRGEAGSLSGLTIEVDRELRTRIVDR